MNLNRKVKNFMGNNTIKDNRNIISDLRKESKSDLMHGDISNFIGKRKEMWDLDRENIKEIGKNDPRIIQPYLDYRGSTGLKSRLMGKMFKGDENYFKSDAQVKSEESGLEKMLQERKMNKDIDREVDRSSRVSEAQRALPQAAPPITINLGGVQPENVSQDMEGGSMLPVKVGSPVGQGKLLQDMHMTKNEVLDDGNELSNSSELDLKGYDLEKLVHEQAFKDHNSIYGNPGENAGRYRGRGPSGGPPGGTPPNPPTGSEGKPESMYSLFSRNMVDDMKDVERSMGGAAGNRASDQQLAIGMLNDRYSHEFANRAPKVEKQLNKTFNTRLEDLILESQLRSTSEDKAKDNTYKSLKDGLTDNMVGKFTFESPDRSKEVGELSTLIGAMNGAAPGVTVNNYPNPEKEAGLVADIASRLDHANYGNRNINIDNLPTPNTRFEHDKLNSYLRRRADDLLYMNLENPTPRMKANNNIARPDTNYMSERVNKPIDSSIMKRYYATKYPEVIGGKNNE